MLGINARARLLVAGALLCAACTGRQLPPRGLHTLPPDSLALLNEALRHARPGYRTQREALQAGAYGNRAAPTTRLAGREAARPGESGEFVIQVAAYQSRALAEDARRRAQLQFPHLTARVEVGNGVVHRVVFVGWDHASVAAGELAAIQRVYPGAWVRRRAVP